MSRVISIVCCCALVYSGVYVKAARILAVFSHPSISHQVVFRPLTHELARRGHEVVVITTDPAFPKGQAPANLIEIDVHEVSYEHWRNALLININGDENDVTKQVKVCFPETCKIFQKQTAVPDIKDIIDNKNGTFDLLLLPASARHALGFSHAVKVPVIAVSSLGTLFDNYDVVGAPIHPLLHYQAVSTRLYDQSLWGKIQQFYHYYKVMNIYKKLEVQENVIMRIIFGENTPALNKLQNNIGMLFLNTHPAWEGNRPVPPGVIYNVGLHQRPEKDLPQDLKKYLDSSENGVIYMSFGSNVNTSLLPADKIQTIVNVFRQLPYDVLWKWDQDELPGRTKNIRISKWLPQSDLLRHPKVKLFITQGGLQSAHETITAGVPVIGIPMWLDQFYNVEKYEHHKIGKKISLDDLNEEKFKSAIRTVIEDNSYRENVLRLRALMHDQPMSSLERAVWWTEHVLRHGARHLRAPAANMGAFEYYDLQLVLIVLGIATAIILLGSLALYKILRLMLVLVV